MILNVIEGEPEPAEAGPGSLFSERRPGGRAAVRALEGGGQEDALTGFKIPRFSFKDSVFASTVENVSASAGTLQCFCKREQHKSVKTVYFAGVQPLASRHEKRYTLRST